MSDQPLARRAMFLKQFDPAISHELVLKALDRLEDIRDAEFYFQKGEERRLKNELSLAISYYERALKMEPEHENSLFYLALCYLGFTHNVTGEFIKDNVSLARSERLERSVFFNRKLINQKRMHNEKDDLLCCCYHNHAVALFRQSKYNEALDSLNCAIQISPDYAHSHRLRGLVKLNLGLVQQALQDAERAIELDRREERSYRILGIIQSAMGQIEQAIESYRVSLKVNPSYVFPYLDLNEEYAKQRRYKDALEILDEALSINPNFPEFYYYYALTEDEFGYGKEAAIYFRKFLRLVPVKSEYYERKIKHAHERLRELQQSH